MKKLAIIGGGRMASIFSKNAREMNIETHCFSLKKGIVEQSSFDYVHDINILEKEELLEICRSLNINGVVATTELTISVAAYVADKMNLNGIPLDIANVITDKNRNRLATRNVSGLMHPGFSVVDSIQEVIDLDFKYPIILKPISKGGKRGISVIYSKEDIENAFSYSKKDSGDNQYFIVEEYIENGIECSVESLSYNGKNYIIQITEKITSGAPHCVELAHHQPANLSDTVKKKIEDVLDEALTRLGIKNGACHTEIKIKDDDIYLIEFNARPGGDHIAYPLTELSTGYSYIKGAINIALNEFKRVEKENFKNKYAGVCFVCKQTKQLKPLFDVCENYEWCYKKNYVSNELVSIIHNDGFNINYFIYCDNKRPDFKNLSNNVNDL